MVRPCVTASRGTFFSSASVSESLYPISSGTPSSRIDSAATACLFNRKEFSGSNAGAPTSQLIIRQLLTGTLYCSPFWVRLTRQVEESLTGSVVQPPAPGLLSVVKYALEA